MVSENTPQASAEGCGALPSSWTSSWSSSSSSSEEKSPRGKKVDRSVSLGEVSSGSSTTERVSSSSSSSSERRPTGRTEDRSSVVELSSPAISGAGDVAVPPPMNSTEVQNLRRNS